MNKSSRNSEKKNEKASIDKSQETLEKKLHPPNISDRNSSDLEWLSKQSTNKHSASTRYPNESIASIESTNSPNPTFDTILYASQVFSKIYIFYSILFFYIYFKIIFNFYLEFISKTIIFIKR